MNLYTINYTKITNGYYKLLNVIESCETLTQLENASNLADNWMILVGYYCDRIKKDFKNIHRNRDARKLVEAISPMFEDIKNIFAQINEELIEKPYEGRFVPCRVKSLPEMVHEMNENEDVEME